MIRDRAARLALVLILVTGLGRACWCHGVLVLDDGAALSPQLHAHLASAPTKWSKRISPVLCFTFFFFVGLDGNGSVLH